MNADKPNTRINPAQEQFDKTQAAVAAKRARRMAEAALHETKPSPRPDAVPVRAWPTVRP